MIIPIRCLSCGKPVAHLWEQYKEKTTKGTAPKQAMEEAGLERYCCKSLFLSHIDSLELVARFKKA